MYILFNCILPPSVSIGSGTRLWHHGWCVGLQADTEIGRDCNIYNQVEITSINEEAGGHPGRVIIGDGVNICTGAKVVCKGGALTIGDGSVVAANAVVESDVPPFSFAAGVPARCRPLKQPETSYSEQHQLVG
jgi:serine O-acetyltransferase